MPLRRWHVSLCRKLAVHVGEQPCAMELGARSHLGLVFVAEVLKFELHPVHTLSCALPVFFTLPIHAVEHKMS